jgi:hypothetical protein
MADRPVNSLTFPDPANSLPLRRVRRPGDSEYGDTKQTAKILSRRDITRTCHPIRGTYARREARRKELVFGVDARARADVPRSVKPCLCLRIRCGSSSSFSNTVSNTVFRSRARTRCG